MFETYLPRTLNRYDKPVTINGAECHFYWEVLVTGVDRNGVQYTRTEEHRPVYDMDEAAYLAQLDQNIKLLEDQKKQITDSV